MKLMPLNILEKFHDIADNIKYFFIDLKDSIKRKAVVPKDGWYQYNWMSLVSALDWSSTLSAGHIYYLVFSSQSDDKFFYYDIQGWPKREYDTAEIFHMKWKKCGPPKSTTLKF